MNTLRSCRSMLLLAGLLIALVFPGALQAQVNIKDYSLNDYKPAWKSVENFSQKGQYQSAREALQEILVRSKQENNPAQQVKSALALFRLDVRFGEEGMAAALPAFEKEAQNAEFPARQILFSLLGEFYGDYISENIYALSDRTDISGEQPDDLETRSMADLTRSVLDAFEASLLGEGIWDFPLDYFSSVLQTDESSDYLFPTLGDFLVFRAIDYFRNERYYLTEPSYAFLPDQEELFADAAAFTSFAFPERDSTSYKLKTLQLFQRYLGKLIAADKPDLAVHTDLMRLSFARTNSMLDDKDELYRDALLRLMDTYEGLEASAVVGWELASFYEDLGETYHASAIPEIESMQKEARFAFQEALRWCELVQATFSSTFAAKQCRALATRIRRPEIFILAEEVYLPQEQGPAKLTFRNCDLIDLWILPNDPLSEEPEPATPLRKNLDKYRREWVKHWQLSLPKIGDYQNHELELAIPGLPSGAYMLIAAPANSDSVWTAVNFEVSGLGLVRHSDEFMLVVDRASGAPLKGAVMRWEGENRFFREAVSDADGIIRLPEDLPEDWYRIWLSYGHEKRLLEDSDYIYNGSAFGKTFSDTTEEPELKMAFFTDRSIYRPGQQLFFKGLALERKGPNYHEILINKEVLVQLRDANYQVVEEKVFASGEFGTFHGFFDLPETGLQGQYRLSATDFSGFAIFRVESYKRPGFEVGLDDIPSAYRLGDTIALDCRATAYSGQPIDGGKVSWQVVRKPVEDFRPWWFGFFRRWYRPQPEQVIAVGQGSTDESGKYSLIFSATAGTPNSGYQPGYYDFGINVTITDINGESHVAQKTVRAGRTAVQLSLEAEKPAQRSEPLQVSFAALNMEGRKVERAMQLEVFQLQPPVGTKINRMWDIPDLSLYDRDTFNTLFPSYAHISEAFPELYPALKRVYSRQFEAGASREWSLSTDNWACGAYKAVLSLVTEAGDTLRKAAFFDMVDTLKAEIPSHITGMALAPARALEPGQQGSFDFLTGDGLLHVYFNLENMDGLRDRGWQRAEPYLSLTYPIREADRGNLVSGGFYVKRNRFYTFSKVLQVPWTNKQLAITWESFRDKMEPGAQESWTIKISGPGEEPLFAEMAATLYDESLDAFLPHRWSLDLYTSLGYGRMNFRSNDFNDTGWGPSDNQLPYPYVPGIDYPDFKEIPGLPDYYFRSFGAKTMAMIGYGEPVSAEMEERSIEADLAVPPPAPESTEPDLADIPLRENLNELVFFEPLLRTDSTGSLVIEFAMNEALSRWKLLALAHTKDLKTGQASRSIITQKPLMVVPNAPRFLRSGDEILLTAKVSNMTDSLFSGVARLYLSDALTGKRIDEAFGLSALPVSFTTKAGQSGLVEWKLKVPELPGLLLQYDVLATAGDYSDGERNVLPILSNRTLITESRAVFLRPGQTIDIEPDRINTLSESSGFAMHRFSLEATPNPVWYAIQTLPYLNEYPFDCTEQLFNKLFAQVTGSAIVRDNPGIKKVLESRETVSSPLELNEELKTSILSETPWVMDALKETRTAADLLKFLDEQQTREDMLKLFEKLAERQSPAGGFSWFPGGQESWYITQYTAEGFMRLEDMGLLDAELSDRVAPLLAKAIAFIDAEAENHLNELKKIARKQKKNYLKQDHLSPMLIHYLFVRSRSGKWESSRPGEAYAFFLEQAEKYWPGKGIYQMGLIAMTLHRENKSKVLREIMRTLREQSFTDQEMGMYWKNTSGYFWYRDPIETQALMIMLFSELGAPESETDELRLWLLKNKQVRQWRSTKATAAAVFVLLNYGTDWTDESGTVVIAFPEADPEVYRATMDTALAGASGGSGYFKASWDAASFRPELADMKWENTGQSPAWGAVYWQYFEDIDRVTAFDAKSVQVSKTLYQELKTEEGSKLVALETSGSELQPGDQLVVRIEIKTDRDLEFVHLKDTRAAGLEPVVTLSGYEWSHGLGYYRQMRDTAADFFIDYLAKGTYVFEYPLVVSHKGDFSAGVATLQCMYAPEFISHSSGSRLSVR